MIAIFGPEPINWFVVSILISLLSVPLSHVNKCVEIIPDPKFRSLILYLILFLPLSGFAYGRQQAFSVLSGKPDLFLDSKRSQLPFLCDASNPVAYLGLLGSTYFFKEQKSGYIALVPVSKELPIFLTPEPSC